MDPWVGKIPWRRKWQPTPACLPGIIKRLAFTAPEAVEQRYKFRPDPESNGFALLEQAAKKRGFLISGGEYDLERMAAVLLDEYRSGKLGRITLEIPEAAK